jgi:hypothetical protein
VDEIIPENIKNCIQSTKEKSREENFDKEIGFGNFIKRYQVALETRINKNFDKKEKVFENR